MFRIRMRGLSALSIGALMVLAVGTAPAAAASPQTRMVDDDGHASNGNCGGSAAAYSTIQSAISASHAGDTIKVCGGDYTENLTVRAAKDNITIVSTQPWQARIWRSTSLPGMTPLVEIRAGADGVVFRHFELLFPTTNDCDEPTVAAIAVAGTNASILGNRIRSDGTDEFFTCGYAIGVEVAPGVGLTTSIAGSPGGGNPPASAAVGWNLLREFQFAGIVVVGDHTRAHVNRNSVHFGHVGAICDTPLVIAAAARGRVSPAGPIPDCFALGIWYDAFARGKIDGNVVVSDALFAPGLADLSPAGISLGEPILFAGIAAALIAGTRPVDILNNDVTLAFIGILAANNGGGGIRDNNTAFTVEAGIDIASDQMDIRRNTISFTTDGIVVETGSATNFLRSNVVTNSFGTACVDDSTGTGTGGTADTWVNNTGDSSNPSGLCAPAAP